METICIIGLGYIGLPTAALLASTGHRVHGVDVNAGVVATINSGRIHIVEPDLHEVVQKAVADGLLTADTAPQSADVFMICVPTPFHEGEGTPTPNLDYVLAATRSIAPHLKAGSIVILESTSPVGSTALVADALLREGVDLADIDIAYCPERVLPGKIMAELVSNDRVVGGLTPRATTRVANFYRSFVKGEVLETTAATAEMCKLTENSFRDVNIAFANELSLLCDRAGIDVWELIALANRHPRVNVLQPGTGVGGHCIAVDPWFLVASDPENARIIRTAREVNIAKTDWVVRQIEIAAAAASGRTGRPATVACLGLAFKPDIDDLRESPALDVAQRLKAAGHVVLAVEPNIERHDTLDLVTLDDAIDRADVLAVLVRHAPFVTAAADGRLAGDAVRDFCGIGFTA